MIKKIFPYIIAFYAFLYRPKRKEYFIEVIERVSVKHDWMSDELYRRYREIMAKRLDELHEKALEELRHSIDLEMIESIDKSYILKKHE